MYPQLCFIDLCYGTVPDSSKELLSSQLSEPTYDSLLQSAPQTASGADSGKNTDDAVSGSDENIRSERPQIGFWFLKLLAE